MMQLFAEINKTGHVVKRKIIMYYSTLATSSDVGRLGNSSFQVTSELASEFASSG